MRKYDLLRQTKLIGPQLANKAVAFVGDTDSTSLLIGLLATQGNSGPGPAHMLMLDFDERLLKRARTFAKKHGFNNVLEVRRYNVFDPLPTDIVGDYDWFYTNPPYGSHNSGASARLFITRGCELCRAGSANGCIILPYDVQRPWTRRAMLATQQFMTRYGWTIGEKLNQLHQYHLDDDKDLTSSLMLADYISGKVQRMPLLSHQL